jgi:hypothetical protein
MSSSLVKQCCDIIQYGKYIISMGAKCGLCGPEFCCAVCSQVLSWSRITPSLRRLGHSPDGLWQAFQRGSLLGIQWTSTFWELRRQHVRWIQKTLSSTLLADSVLGELGCSHSVADGSLVWAKRAITLSLSLITSNDSTQFFSLLYNIAHNWNWASVLLFFVIR